MTVELSPEQLEMVLIALKEQVSRRRAEGQSAYLHEDLIARLEVAERDLRRAAAHAGATPDQRGDPV